MGTHVNNTFHYNWRVVCFLLEIMTEITEYQMCKESNLYYKCTSIVTQENKRTIPKNTASLKKKTQEFNEYDDVNL